MKNENYVTVKIPIKPEELKKTMHALTLLAIKEHIERCKKI